VFVFMRHEMATEQQFLKQHSIKGGFSEINDFSFGEIIQCHIRF
jgi:hypothetical protein